MTRAAALLAAATLLAAPVAAQEEGGTLVTLMRISLPDTLPAGVPAVGLNELAMRVTSASDGRRVATQLSFDGTEAAMGLPLEALTLHAIWDAATDSVKIGLTLPPELMEMLGGGAGLAFAMVLPDTIPAPPGMTDSLMLQMANAGVGFRDLGRDAVVGGLPCREYEMTSDSLTAQVCLGPRPAGLALMDSLLARVPGLGAMMEAWREQQVEMLGTTGLGTMRMTADMDNGGFHMELASYTPGRPDPGLFVLAPGLVPPPPEIIAAFMQGVAAATAAAADSSAAGQP